MLGIEKETGSIEAGKSADLMLVANNPIEDLSALSMPKKVMVRGKLISNPKVKKNVYIEETLDNLLKA